MIKATLDDVPKKLYNIVPDLPSPLPMPKGNVELMGKIFPKGFLEQEMSQERFIEIPEEIRKCLLKIGRPTPLQRAHKLEKAIGTKSKIFYKREDCTTTGSHKINSALMQVYLAKKEGIKKIVTETGAGQWGTALSLAGSLLGVDIEVFMVNCSYNQKPYRKHVMKLYGAKIKVSPSVTTKIGRELRKDPKNKEGSLGIAIAEAVEAAQEPDSTYSTTGSVYGLGSVLNAVITHQSIIGEETLLQLKKFNIKPDIVVGCTGGGSNFGGMIGPIYREFKDSIEYIATEPANCPTLTKGEYKYDYGDTGKQTPLLKMHTLGCDFVPRPDHAGGLRYHGMAPIISLLVNDGIIKPKAYDQEEIFAAGKLFAKTEGIIPAPESCHAIKGAIDAALSGEKNVVFVLSGHGLLDLAGYEKYL